MLIIAFPLPRRRWRTRFAAALMLLALYLGLCPGPWWVPCLPLLGAGVLLTPEVAEVWGG